MAEKLDSHRKRQQAQYPGLTLTGIYNVLEKLRCGEVLTAQDKIIHEQGLVSLLRELHDELDRAVFTAYSWEDLAKQLVGLSGATVPLPDRSEAHAAAEGELLTRLVELNTQRAAEETRGHIRWLRPEYQNPSAVITSEQTEVEFVQEETAPTKPQGKSTWPKNMREQVATVRQALQQTSMTAADITQQFKRSPIVAVQSVLDALQDLGMVELEDGRYRIQG